MECNRDEAIRAKGLAERSMGNKDFASARRFALKAQRLYPNLEDISKIILVCDVLCSEKILMYRKEENDWYAILQIEPTADETTIRKQYCKFGLSLHPDKNKFPGASDALQMVNEAHRTLLDGKSRLDYDLKLKVARSIVNTHPSPRDVSVNEKANFEGNALNTNLRKDGVHKGNDPGFVEVKGNLNIDSTSQDFSDPDDGPFSELVFYDFRTNICPSKFHVGQIWAIYCDEDSLPKNYCKIMGIKPYPTFNVHVDSLVACQPPEEMISRADDIILTTVGNFKPLKGKPHKYSSTDPFSHVVSAEPTDYQDVYSIFPKKDQIWALYKNWNPLLTLSDLDECEYEIVKIIGENDLCILVSMMKAIIGLKSVFRPQVEGRQNHKVEIPKNEILRFSHQIPAFQLTNESLYGFSVLDAAAFPRHLSNQ